MIILNINNESNLSMVSKNLDTCVIGVSPKLIGWTTTMSNFTCACVVTIISLAKMIQGLYHDDVDRVVRTAYHRHLDESDEDLYDDNEHHD